MSMNLTIQEIAYHRNGISGEPFYVLTFRDEDEDREMVAIVFDFDADADPAVFTNCRTAVFDREELAAGNIAFAQGNSWRGDYYDADLRQALRVHERQLSAEWSR